MDILYKVTGVRAIGDGVSLIIMPVKIEEKKLNTTKIISNLGGFMDDMKSDAIRSRNPDNITITKDEYAKGIYALGNIITISINSEG